MMKALLWINRDSEAGDVPHSTRAQRSLVQSQIQRGRPRKRALKKPNDRPREPNGKKLHLPVKPKELYDLTVRSILADLDPFDSVCITIDSTTKGLLRYYVYYYHPAQWPNESLRGDLAVGMHPFERAVREVVNTAIADPVMMFTLLSSAASRLQYVDKFFFANVKQKEASYAATALRLLQTRAAQLQLIEDQSGLGTLLQCITFMLSAEAYRGNLGAARVHLVAALAVLKPYGGIEALQDKHIQGQLLMADLAYSSVTFTPPLCSCHYDPGPASTLNLQSHELGGEAIETKMGSSLLRRQGCGLPHELRDLVEQILEVYHVATGHQKYAMSRTRAQEIGRWVTLRNMAIRNHLLSALNGPFDRNQITRIALVMWTLLAMNITGRVKTVKIMAAKLKSCLARLPVKEWDGMEDIRLWIVLLIHACASDQSNLRLWCLYAIRRSARAASWCGTVGLEELVKFQKGFLYHIPVQMTTDQELVTELSAAFWR